MTRTVGVLLLLVLALGCAERPSTTIQTPPDFVGEYTGAGLTASLVLQAFNFRFLNGDHHLGRVRLLAGDSESVRALFADDNLDDTWELSARYVTVEGIPTLEQAIDCTSGLGYCDIDLGLDVTEGHRFALVGFEFQRIGGGDHHIKAIGIVPISRMLRVTFHDNTPEDDQFRCVVQYKILPFNDETGFPVRGFVSGDNSRRIEETLGGESNDRVLSGFQFNYTQNDAHVLELGTNIGTGNVRFRDNDLEELISWDVAFLQLEHWSPSSP